MTDNSRSRAILIGTANYHDAGFPPLPAAANSLSALREVLTSAQLCDWAPERITVLEDPTDAPRTLQSLRRLARDTDDVLLVYFVGHGVLQRRAELSLVLADTDSIDSDLTGLDYQRIREILLDSPAQVKIVILDCCYSGRAIEALLGAVADSTDTHGVYTLTASDHAAHVVPLVQQQDTTTSFTGELVDLIRDGIPDQPERLTLGTLYVHLRRRLQRRGLPIPNRRGTDTADQFPFTKNVAYQQEPTPVPDLNPSRRRTTPQRPVSRDLTVHRLRLAVAILSVILVAAAAIIWPLEWGPAGEASHGGTQPSRSTTNQSAGSTVVPYNYNGGSPTIDRMLARGRAIIGVNDDQPGLGFKNSTTGAYSGFEIEIAKLIAARLGLPVDTIEFTTITSDVRELEISQGAVDYYVGTYVITEQRKEQVSFAGPYYMAGQDLLVRKDDLSITGTDTLKGKFVCSVFGSTSMVRIVEAGVTEEYNYVHGQSISDDVDQLLLANHCDTVTADDAILRGYVAALPDKLRVVGKPFSDEPYGVGMVKEDDVLRDMVNDILQDALDSGTWDDIYERTLGESGPPPRKPTIQR